MKGGAVTILQQTPCPSFALFAIFQTHSATHHVELGLGYQCEAAGQHGAEMARRVKNRSLRCNKLRPTQRNCCITLEHSPSEEKMLAH